MTEKTAQKEPGKKPVPSKKPKPQQEVVVQIPLSELHDFPNHPFKVRDDEDMQETAESIRQYGVLVPAIVRPREDGGYEIIAGHRRRHGSELAGLSAMPCIVRQMDDDTATILMVDSNIQRENMKSFGRSCRIPRHTNRGTRRFLPSTRSTSLLTGKTGGSMLAPLTAREAYWGAGRTM